MRHDLVLALVGEALDVVDEAMARVDLDGAVPEVLEELVTTLVPLGPRLEFLLRFPGLESDERLAARLEVMDKPVIDFVRRGQETGALRADLPAWWVADALYAGIYGRRDPRPVGVPGQPVLISAQASATGLPRRVLGTHIRST